MPDTFLSRLCSLSMDVHKLAPRNLQPPSTGVRSLAETKHSTLADSEEEDAKNAASAAQS